MAPNASKKTKKKEMAQKKKMYRAGGGGAQLVRARGMLDSYASEWAALLADPCGAKLTNPVFEGVGGGMFVRTKTVVGPPATATDYVICLQPGVSNGAFAGLGYSTTVGGALGTMSAIAVPNFLTSGTVGSYRCIAACIKVIYTGAVTAAQGRVGLLSEPGGAFATPTVVIGPNALTLLTRCQADSHVADGGRHEARWLPNTGDGFPLTTGAVAGYNIGAGAVSVVVFGQTANTSYVEINACWEYTAPDNNATSGIVSSTSVSRSTNKLNDVLNYLQNAAGGLARFATDPNIVSAVRGGSMIANAFRTTYSVASKVAPLAIAAL